MVPARPTSRSDAERGTSGGPRRTALRAARPAMVVPVALAVLLLVLATTGGGGSALRTGRPFAHLVLGLAIAAVLGCLVVAAGEPDRRSRERLLDSAAVAAALQAVAAGTIALLLYAGDAPAVTDPRFGPGLVAFLLELPVGRAWLAAAVGAALLTAVAVAVRSRRGAVVALALALVALVPVALTAAAPGDFPAVVRTADAAGWLRLAGVGTWLGVLALAVARGGAGRRPARLGVACAVVGVVAAASTALLRRESASAGLLALDAVLLLVAGLAAVATTASGRPAGVLLRAQLVLLAAATGLAAAPALTDPAAAAAPPRTSPAAILTGVGLPAPLTPGTLLTTWRVDPVLLLVCAGLVAAYAATVRRVRARGERLQAARIASWGLGVLLLAWLTCGGLAVYREVLLGAAVAQLLSLALVVPLLLAGGGPLVLARRPVPPALRVLSRPQVAAVVLVAVLALLLLTDLLRWALTDPIGAVAAPLLCLAAGGLLVHALVGSGATASLRRRTVVAAVLLLIAVAGGAWLLVAPGLLQADWFGAMGWGTDALAAQRGTAGVVWALAGGATLILLLATVRRRVPRPSLPGTTRLLRPTEVDA